MRKVITIGVLLLSMAACRAAGQTVALPFTFEHGEVVLSLEVNGKLERIILDTGAVDTALTADVLQSNTVLATNARSADGKETVTAVGSAMVKVGSRAFNAQVLVIPKMLYGTKGLLGQNVLSLFKSITVNYKNHTVIFES